MRIVNIGYNHSHDADFSINRPTGSGDWLLLLLKTSAIFTFDGRDTVTSPDSFILFRKDTPQIYRANGFVFTNDWFHFTIEKSEAALFDALDIPFDKIVQLGDINSLSMIIQNMCYENYSTNLYKTDSAELFMKLFFVKLSEKLHYVKDDKINSFYDKMSLMRTKIYNMPYTQWSVNWLAHELALSKSYFQHLYKETFGVSVMSDVVNSRVQHGKYLLKSTDYTVKKIAELCGYHNEIHFMRQFKEKTGMTPSEYRENGDKK